MSFNPAKCVKVRTTRKRNPINATYKIHNHDLEMVKQGKFLGVTLAGNLSWNKHVDETTKRQTPPLLSCGEISQDVQARSRPRATLLSSDRWLSMQLPSGTPTLPETFSSSKLSNVKQQDLP